jgi:hyperosmotically inducible periplasmic protein
MKAGSLALLFIASTWSLQGQETLVGCVAGERENGAFVLKRDSGEERQVAGPRELLLDQVGHRVELHGDYVNRGEAFQVATLKRLDGNCENKTSRVTAADQGMSRADTGITQKIRRAVTGDKSLSTLAHNVTIVTRDGVVTLGGPVRSEQEKQNIEAKAASVAGAANVRNEIVVKRDKSDEKKR